VAAYGVVIGSTLWRAVDATLARAGADKPTTGLVAAAGAGVLLLFVALFFDGRALGLSLFLAGGAYVGFLVAYHPGIDPAAPLIAVLLLLTGELAAWSLDERWALRVDTKLVWRRIAALTILALGGLALAALAVGLSAAPAAHGLPWTILGAIAAVAVAWTAITLVRR
jgi:hypothetical protein